MARTNVPDGMNQQNRTHPYFIILRKLVQEEQDAFHATSRKLVTDGMILFIPFILYIPHLIFNTNAATSKIFIGFWAISMLAKCALILRQTVAMRDVVQVSVNVEVDHMIYSNEFQMVGLNEENIINMMSRASSHVGISNALRKSFHETCIIFVTYETLMSLILLIIGIIYS